MKYFINQVSNKDCGFTCLKMLLSMKFKNKNYLFLQSKDSDNLNIYQLINLAKFYNLKLNGYLISENNKKELFRIKKKFILLLKKDNVLHSIIVKKKILNYYLIYDPAEGIKLIKKSKLLENWTGIILKEENTKKLNKIKQKKKVIKIFKPNFLRIYEKIIMILFEVISLSFLILSFFFLELNSIISIILSTMYILFSILSKKVKMIYVNKIENRILDFVTNNNINKEKLNIYFKTSLEYKFISTHALTSFFVNILSLIFIFILLIINSLTNLYLIFLSIVIFLLINLIFNNKCEKTKYKIEILENEITTNIEIPKAEVIKKNKDLNFFSNKLFNILFLKKYLYMFFSIFFVLILMLISNIYTINFAIFYFIIYETLFKLYEKIYFYKNDALKLKNLQNKLIYLIN